MATNEVSVPWSTVWYIRSAINRAVIDTERRVEDFEKWLTDNPDNHSSIAESMRGAVEHEKQWLREAISEFTKLDDGFLTWSLQDRKKVSGKGTNT